jgi:hypothetical protein
VIIAVIFAAGALTAAFLERGDVASTSGVAEGEPVAFE